MKKHLPIIPGQEEFFKLLKSGKHSPSLGLINQATTRLKSFLRKDWQLTKHSWVLASLACQKAISQAYKTYYLPLIGSLAAKREAPFVNEIKIWKKELPKHTSSFANKAMAETKSLYTRTVAPLHTSLLPHLQTYIPKYFHSPLAESLQVHLPKWVGAAVFSLVFALGTSGILLGAGITEKTLDYQTLANEFQLSQAVIKTQHLGLGMVENLAQSDKTYRTNKTDETNNAGQVLGTKIALASVAPKVISKPTSPPVVKAETFSLDLQRLIDSKIEYQLKQFTALLSPSATHIQGYQTYSPSAPAVSLPVPLGSGFPNVVYTPVMQAIVSQGGNNYTSSSLDVTTNNATVNANLNVLGNSNLSRLTVTGTVSLATTTISSLNASSLALGFTQGSVIFQGANALSLG